ncbi:hypothetical protein AU106_gp179 [Sinorhizobium phage phiM9]|uniref:Uncharacterized protein n=1 Tax=Sinorhizobium phage phiM9 TaxID=1636182 RepID=A0A0F6R608_9CAUD|nr:hypothetical protein AU106_gp179 [Sinorhizobium phage phiM9]AKE44810.1 hypothetical protein Sm_phiM9_183 [Sinorhizobium phage phiM9]
MSDKIGQIYYTVFTDESDGKVSIEEYHVVTIRGDYVYAAWKIDGITYGKKSKKAGDFGWLRPLPDWTRKKFHRKECEKNWKITPDKIGLYTTKLQAIRAEIKEQDELNFDEPALFEKAMRTLKSMETRERNKK